MVIPRFSLCPLASGSLSQLPAKFLHAGLRKPYADVMAKEANASLDAFDRGTLQKDLPGISVALDRSAMSRWFQAELIGLDGSNQLQRCSLVSAILLEGCAVLRYELELIDAVGRSTSTLVTGRVFPDASRAEAYAAERLIGLAAQVVGRVEVKPLTTPLAVVAELGMALYAYPIDGELPTLAAATDESIAGLAIEQLLRANGLPDVDIQGCRAEPIHYNRRHRCMLRYGLDLVGGKSFAVYGKVTSDDSGASIPRIVEALTTTFTGAGVALPECLGWHEELQLVAFTEIPGAPRVAQLLKARLRGDQSEGAVTLEDAVDMCGRIAAALHTSGLSLGDARPLETELARLRANLSPIRRLSPALGKQLGNLLEVVERRAASIPATGLCQCHGDFSYTQLIFDGPRAGLVDFDNFCRAEPALDLGQFLAYLRYAGIKARGGSSAAELRGPSEDLAQRFATSYVSAGGRPEALDRVELYEATNLVRMAEHAWQNLKSRRLNQIVALLEERLMA